MAACKVLFFGGDAVNEIFHTLWFTRNVSSDVRCTLTKIVKGLAMIRHMALQWIGVACPFNVLEQVLSLLCYCTVFGITGMVSNESQVSTSPILSPCEGLNG